MHNPLTLLVIFSGVYIAVVAIVMGSFWLYDRSQDRRSRERWLQEYDSAPGPWRWPDLDDHRAPPLPPSIVNRTLCGKTRIGPEGC